MILHSRAIRSKSRKIVKFVKIMAQSFLNSERTCNSTDIQASMYNRKTTTRPFDTMLTLDQRHYLRSLSLVQSLSKGRNAPIWRNGNRRVRGQ